IGQQIQEVKIKKELDALPGNDDGIKVEGYSPDVVPTALGADTPPDDEGFSTLLEHGEPAWTVESNRIRHAWRYFLLTPEEIDTFADEGKTPDAEARISVMHEMEIDGNEETLFLHQWEEPSSPAPQAPSIEMTTRRSRWDEKPETAHRTIDNAWEITPSAVGVLPNQSPPSKKRRTRWDQPPVETIRMNSATTDCEDASPITPGMVSTYSRNLLKTTAITAVAESSPMTPGSQLSRWCHQDIKQRNRPMADEELDTIFPPSYQILIPPSDYNPTETLNHQLTITPDTDTRTGFFMQTENVKPKFEDNMMKRNLPFMKPDDTQFFGKLLIDVDEYSLTVEELKERQIMNLLLKIKNGEPPIRKIAMRHITNKAREFGAGPLFNQILPLMMNVTLEDHERHQLVKVIDRILFKLDNLVRPYVHGILIVIEPLLIDEDYYA
uniref:Splicing factor 3B subunit 1 domain-containing protein n=1 Tax=Anopheles maculatus TaxID=74869 RepID=A0A182T461_9DIPT